MKINEFVNEGIITRAMDAAKRYGFAGRGAQIQAWAKRQGEERAAARSVIDTQKREAFITQFKKSYELGKSSSRIDDSSVPVPESINGKKDYIKLNSLLESRIQILTESITTEQFVLEYAKRYVSKYVHASSDPTFESDINKIAAEIKSSNASNETVGKLYDYLFSVIGPQQQDTDRHDQGYSGRQYPFPNKDTVVNDATGNKYTFKLASTTWLDDNGRPVDPKMFNLLNKYWWNNSFSTATPQDALPEQDETVTASSGNIYYFKSKNNSGGDDKWRLQSGAAPNPLDPNDKIVTKPANITALNKLAAQPNI